jgi:hypothetical protein
MAKRTRLDVSQQAAAKAYFFLLVFFFAFFAFLAMLPSATPIGSRPGHEQRHQARTN